MRYKLAGLDCASCAAKIDRELHKIKGLEQATINFAALSLDLPREQLAAARETIARVEPGVKILDPAGRTPAQEDERVGWEVTLPSRPRMWC